MTVRFNVDNRLTTGNAAGTRPGTYTITRSVDGGAPAGVGNANQNLTGQASYSATDNTAEAKNSCNGIVYTVTITAWGKTFTATTGDSRPTGTLGFVNTADSLTISKGELAGQVRLQWNMTGVSGSTVYKVYRQTMNRGGLPSDTYRELETITSNASTLHYTDNNVLPGIFYRYKVAVFQTCSATPTELASKEGIGFTQAFGTISGRVTYGTGIAVSDVNMLVRRNSLNDGESQYYSLESGGGGQEFNFSTPAIRDIARAPAPNWTFQFWIRPTDRNGTSLNDTLGIGSFDSLRFHMIRVANGFQISANSTNNTYQRSSVIPANAWSHITFTRSGNNLTIHTIIDNDPNRPRAHTKSGSFTRTTASANTGIFSLGRKLNGHIDDVRFWNRVLPDSEIVRDYNRRLAGNENGLRGYWTFDDGLTGTAFDMSRAGTVYNGNHAVSNGLSFSNVLPGEHQLSLKGITNADGNYQISGIPFQGEGTSYSVVPVFGTHMFSPSEHFRYIGTTSMVHNATDFTNISSFDKRYDKRPQL